MTPLGTIYPPSTHRKLDGGFVPGCNGPAAPNRTPPRAASDAARNRSFTRTLRAPLRPQCNPMRGLFRERAV